MANPEVSRLRNELDGLLLGDVSKYMKRDKKSTDLAHKAKPYVLDLMKIRDLRAQESGFSLYVDLILFT